MGGTITVVKGESIDLLRQVCDGSGSPFALITNPSPFVSSDVLSLVVWLGGELAPVLTTAPTWTDATGAAVYRASFAPSDTAALGVGGYRFQTTATRAGKTGVIDRGQFVLSPSPTVGAAAPLLAFTTIADLKQHAPWIEDVQSDADQFIFGTEQLRATNRLIDALAGMWPTSSSGAPGIGQPGFNAYSMGGGFSAAPSKWLRDVITPLTPGGTIPASMAQNRLTTPVNIVRPSLSTALLLYDGVLEICAKWSLAAILKAQLGRNSDKGYWALASMFSRDAASLFRATKFQIDLSNPQQGYSGITIDGGGGSM